MGQKRHLTNMSTLEIMFRVNETESIASDPTALLSLFNPVQGHDFLVCRETGRDGDNPHYHGIATIDVQMAALRKRMQRFGFTGNQAYSLKLIQPAKRQDYLKYLCKGTGTGSEDAPDIRHQENFSDEDVAGLYRGYWVTNQILSEERAKKRTRTQSAGAQILELARSKKLRIKEDVAREVFDWYLVNKTTASHHQMKGVFCWVMSHLNENYYQSQIEKLME